MRKHTCLFYLALLSLFFASSVWAGDNARLGLLNVQVNLVSKPNGDEDIQVSGTLVNRGEGDLFRPQVFASLLDEEGSRVMPREVPITFSASPVALRKSQVELRDRYGSIRLQQVLTTENRIDFKTYFSPTKSKVGQIELQVVFETGYVSNEEKTRVNFLFPVFAHAPQQTAVTEQLFQGQKPFWEILRFGMTLPELMEKLVAEKYVASKENVLPQWETVLIQTYRTSDDRLRLSFHKGRLFSYRLRLPSSKDRAARKAMLTGLSNVFQGRIVSSSGEYLAADNINSEEYYGQGGEGVVVETQGDWLLVYKERMLKEVQRAELQGR
jgi:hypothetical protein